MLSQEYMTAWFNYYLHRNTDYYTYLYGTEADADVSAGLIERQMASSPRGVVASDSIRAVYLAWHLYDHPIVAGHNIYRRVPGENYPNLPNVQVGRRSSYLDTGLAGERIYHFRLCRRDPAGNLHQLSDEVSAISWASGECTFLPLILRYAQ